jgi:hypothetical protein
MCWPDQELDDADWNDYEEQDFFADAIEAYALLARARALQDTLAKDAFDEKCAQLCRCLPGFDVSAVSLDVCHPLARGQFVWHPEVDFCTGLSAVPDGAVGRLGDIAMTSPVALPLLSPAGAEQLRAQLAHDVARRAQVRWASVFAVLVVCLVAQAAGIYECCGLLRGAQLPCTYRMRRVGGRSGGLQRSGMSVFGT